MKFRSRNIQRVIRHKRIRQTIKGTDSIPRLCVFKSNKYIYAQIINDFTHTTLVSATSMKAEKTMNAKTVEVAKIVGKNIAIAAKEKNITKVVFDRGGYIFHGRVKALADAARENGLQF